MTTKTINNVLKEVMRQRKNKTLKYDGDKYIGAEVTSACMFKLQDLVINRLHDNMFDISELVMQHALSDYQIMTVRDYRSIYGDVTEMENLDLDMFIDFNKQNGKTKSFDDEDVKSVCKYLRENYGYQLN